MNILIVTPSGDIAEPRQGSHNRAFYLAKTLKKAGNSVTILQPRNNGNSQVFRSEFETHTYSQRLGTRNTFIFNDVNPFFLCAVARLLIHRPVDIVQVELPWGVAAVWAMRKLTGKTPTVVYNSQNAEANLYGEIVQRARAEKGLRFSEIAKQRILAINTRIVEFFSARLSDVILCVSDTDKLTFINMYGLTADKIKLIPNGTSIQEAQSASCDKDAFGLDPSKIAVVFHGTYTYLPNKLAVLCIRDRIAPHFKKHHPLVEFVVAGDGVPTCTIDNVKCLGFVEDIHSLLKSSDVAIVPIESGGGTRLKILDYFAAGLPVVSTRKGIEGIEVVDHTHAIITDGIDELIEALNCLVDDRKEWERLSTNAFEFVKNKYDWDRIGERLNEHYLQLLGTPH